MSDHDPIVYVLGAGFSASAGHPLMAQFARVVQELATNTASALNADDRARFQRVLDYRWKMHRLYAYLNLDLDNLEHLFSLIDMETSLGPRDGEAESLRDDLVFVLVKTLELTLRKYDVLENAIRPDLIGGDLAAVRRHRQNGNHHTARYANFVQRLRSYDTVLTFNYDTVLEDAMLVHGVGPDYGIGEPPWKMTDRTVPVLKLHGSSNFVVLADGSLEVADHELLERTTEHYFSRGTPLLIPPSWNKNLLDSIIRDIWSRAARSLHIASKIVFIGYSLPQTDLSFRYLLADSVADNDKLRNIFVVDPGEETGARYKEFVAEAFKKQGKFQAMTQRIEDGVPAAVYAA